jgi:hypothetical protein
MQMLAHCRAHELVDRFEARKVISGNDRAVEEN